jgi:RNA polymerase sigma-70 factor, ECF subfamily
VSANTLLQMAERDAGLGLDALVASHQRSVWRFLRALGADRGLADELTQDTFLLAWQRRLVANERAAAQAWLLRTARFLWLERLRQRRTAAAKASELLLHLWQRHLADDGGDAWLEALRECCASLAPRAARAVQLTYGDGLPRDCVAAAVGLRANGLKTLLQRTRATLRACIERRLP